MQTVRPHAVTSPYTLLGVTPSCSVDEIRAAYKKRVLETHPDKGGDPEEFQKVQRAYADISRAPPAPAAPLPSDRSRSPRRFNVKEIFAKAAVSERMAKNQSTEEESHSAFSSFPVKPRSVDSSRGGGTTRHGMHASKVTVPAARTRSISIVKLWERLTKLSPKQRQEAMVKLESTTKAELTQYLQKRKSTRVTPTESTDAASGSSGTSSSSSSDDSSDSEQIGGKVKV